MIAGKWEDLRVRSGCILVLARELDTGFLQLVASWWLNKSRSLGHKVPLPGYENVFLLL